MARVIGNTAALDGGGIYNDGGILTLNGSAQVSGNVAGASGGGIFNSGPFNVCDTWTGATSPNTQ